MWQWWPGLSRLWVGEDGSDPDKKGGNLKILTRRNLGKGLISKGLTHKEKSLPDSNLPISA